VLAIDQIASEADGKPTIARAVTVEVTKEQAQKILLATDVGKLSLILRKRFPAPTLILARGMSQASR
jgi:pilus assembly protein CpaB